MHEISLHLHLLACALMTSIACALPGPFLILRGTSFMSDALGHAILLGIVLAFFVVKTLHSPWIFVGATLVGLVMVACIEYLIATKKIKQDSAIGLMFPFLFSIAIILINVFAHNIHLDTDAVLLGELAYAPLYQYKIFNLFSVPVATLIMSAVAAINLLVIFVLYKILIVATFDPDFSAQIQIKQSLVHYALMTITAITIIATFECAGTILIVSFMVVPAATAYLITKELKQMMQVSILLAMIGATTGCLMAHCCNVSIAGCIALCNFLWFAVFLYKH
jgi:manganese/zinc/iron transport system permease protein